jgi:ABC-type Fe3+-siderophore transport system permease subunit
MLRKTVRFFSAMLTALILGAGLAHLYSLPNKISLSREEYAAVQQIYTGWAWLGVVLVAAIVCTLAAAVMLRRRPKALVLTLIALGCISASLVVFFQYTYPANQQTGNWTILPANWQDLRAQWEYSHAVNAGLYLCALSALTLSMLVRDWSSTERLR